LTPAGWRPVAPAVRARLHPRSGSPCRTRSLLHSLLSQAAAEHARPPLPPHSCVRLPELAVPATTTHRQRLHLPPSTVFSSRNPCSPWLAVVMPLSSVIARRRSGMLTGKNHSVGTSFPLHLSPSFLAHEHSTVSLMLSSASTHPAVARDASSATTRAAASPCMAAGFPSFLGHVAGTVGLARGWGSRRSSWPGRRPHRRRGHAG
jgi:hypothetical protein